MANKTFKNMKELEKYLQKKIDDVLDNEVKEVATRTLKEKVIEEVYDRYDPEGYQRTGGLLQDRNIEAEVKNGTLSVRSTREENGRDIAEIIEHGVGYNWKNSKIYQMQPFARPFHYEAYLEMKNTLSHIQAMKKGLKRNGINVK